METVEGAAGGFFTLALASPHGKGKWVGGKSVGHLTEWWIRKNMDTGIGGYGVDCVFQAFRDHSSFAEDAATRKYP